MKTFLYTLFTAFLFWGLFAGCTKEKETTPEPVTPVKAKYLHKVFEGEHLSEVYTWDEQKRLVQIDYLYWYLAGTTYKLKYNGSKLDSIYYSTYQYGTYSGKFYYDLNNRINKMECAIKHSEYESPRYHLLQYVYSQNNKIDTIKFTFNIGQNEQTFSYVYFQWLGNNKSSEKMKIFPHLSINYATYDDKVNPYHVFPQIVLFYLADVYAANTSIIASQNNLLSYSSSEDTYKYDYDEDGYPVVQYEKKNDQWVVKQKYIYLPN